MKIICITGGIGSGKSLVAKIIETIGYPVYYSDERAKQLYFDAEIKPQIIELLGTQAYIDDKAINKKYIAEKIFSDKSLLEKINNIIHTAVKNDFQKFLNAHKDQTLIFKESALIFEAGLKNTCDKIILVTAPKEVRIKRVMNRDNLSEQEVLSRMNHQWDDEKKIPLADYVINNIETEPLLPKVLEVLEDLKK